MAPVNYLAQQGVNMLIAGGMGLRPLMGFNQVGIDVYHGGAAATVGEALNAAIEGKLSQFSQQHTCGGVYWFRRWKATAEGRRKWDLLVLEIPLFGPLLIMVAVTRFARTLATLLASGVPVLTAMDITRNVLGNTELMRVVEDARASVSEGEGIAKPLRQAGRFPPIVTHMIAVGERTGQLEEMLVHVADAYDQQIEVRVGAMTSILEPLLIVVMGVVVGGIAFAILMPLLQLNEMIQ